MFKIQQKIVLLSCAIAWTATLILGAIDYRADVTQAEEQSVQILTRQAALIQERLQHSASFFVYDARMISQAAALRRRMQMPPSQSLGPVGEFTDEEKRVLTRIFRIIMQARPTYKEIVLVGHGSRGREIVRVTRVDAGVTVTPYSDLIDREGTELHEIATGLEPGNWHFPEVRFPEERKRSPPDMVAMQTLILSLPSQAGRPTGYVAISADARKFAAQSLDGARLSNSTFVLDGVGNLLASRLSGEDIEAGAFQDPPSYDDLPARLMFHSDEGAEKNALVRSGGQFFATDGGGQGDPRMPKFQVVISEPVAKMLEIPESAARNSLLLGGLATFVSGVIAGGFAFWITRPLAQIADTLREYRWNTPLEGLPSGLKDEIGDVARAFETLIERLTKSEMRARAIVESIHDALIVIDLNGRILEFSGMAEEMFDYRRAEVVGRSVAILMPEPYKSQYDQYLKRFRDTGEGEPLEKMREMQARRRNGEIFPIEFSFSSLGSGDSQTLVGTVRDITERKRAEEMKDGFISAVNHELRTPLTAINAALNLLDEHASSSFDEKSKRLMELALSGSSRLAKLVNDILDLRRIESGLLAHHAKCTDIKAAVADIVNRYGPLAERFQIAFRLDLAKRDITVFVDPGRFEQAMVHLLSNAAKYSPAGEQVTVRVREHEGEWVRISIIDKGPGIPENIRERIIESFSETEPENLVTEGRIGMGLRMAKSLVETFNGRISFWTELGAGTSFHIDLPILDAGEVGLADA